MPTLTMYTRCAVKRSRSMINIDGEFLAQVYVEKLKEYFPHEHFNVYMAMGKSINN